MVSSLGAVAVPPSIHPSVFAVPLRFLHCHQPQHVLGNLCFFAIKLNEWHKKSQGK